MALFSLRLVACVAPLLASVLAATSTTSAAVALPTVDLGYELHQAIAYNDTGAYYNFSNIRYAAPPTGNNRFRPPVSPATNRSVVQLGEQSRICPQSDPAWIDFASGWITEYLTGKAINLTLAEVNALNDSISWADVPAPAAAVSEDCLFLDVMVPKQIFDKGLKNATGAPVLVWIYGGGYTAGSKTGSGNPAGLIHRSEAAGKEGIIFVALNYRLGAFGWLAGATLQSDGVANAGLYDQRYALEWVQKNIHLFGGDANRVTVMGESAGGGSIMHQVTAYGGLLGAPFQQAIFQSAAFLPQVSSYALESQYNELLAITNSTTLAELRALTTEQLIAANYIQVSHAGWGQFTYGPSVDGIFVPALPGRLLLQGNFVKDIHIMVGHNLDEGLIFTDPLIQNETSYRQFLQQFLPDAHPSVLDYIEFTLYPPVFNGTYGYTDQIGRTDLTTTEGSFSCNSNFLDRAFNNSDYSYFFTVPPGLHGQDIVYTFYNGGLADLATELYNTTAAVILQDWITTFAQNGKPTTPGLTGVPKFVTYGKNATVEDLGLSSVTHVMDPTANPRCLWWQQALYY